MHALHIKGKSILWEELWKHYEAKISLSSHSEGLFLLKSKSKEHLDLTSNSRMRVDLLLK